jgi:DNA-binding transcriptional ArsR family regulator
MATKEKSAFASLFAGTPQIRMIDFLLEHRLSDFTKTEIAKGAGISWATLFNHWEELEKYGLVKITRTVGRARLYQLNEASPIVANLKKIEATLMRHAADEAEGKMEMKVKAKSSR